MAGHRKKVSIENHFQHILDMKILKKLIKGIYFLDPNLKKKQEITIITYPIFLKVQRVFLHPWSVGHVAVARLLFGDLDSPTHTTPTH